MILGSPFQIWSGMVDAAANGIFTSSVFGVKLPVTNKTHTKYEYPPSYLSEKQLAMFEAQSDPYKQNPGN